LPQPAGPILFYACRKFGAEINGFLCTIKALGLIKNDFFMNSDTGKYLMLIGGAVVVIGLVIYFFHDKLHWIGHLPGDIRIEKENFRFYFPITTMILLSVLVTVILSIIRRFL
jgi:hypothetical protein